MEDIKWTQYNTITGKYPAWMYQYWCDFLYRRLESAYEFECPVTWDKDFLFDSLFINTGVLTVFTDEKFGTIPLYGTYQHYNIFDRPVTVRVLKTVLVPEYYTIDRELTIGKDCILLKPFRDGTLFFRKVIEEFGHRLALLAPSVDMSILNSRLAYVFAAKDKASGETIKAIMEKVFNGQPAVTYDKYLGRPDDRSDSENWNFVQLNPTSAYLVDKLLADYDTILRQFDEIVGIPTQPTKKERLITAEAEGQELNTFSIANKVKSTINEQGKLINEMFGVTVKLHTRDEYTKPTELDEEGTDNE